MVQIVLRSRVIKSLGPPIFGVMIFLLLISVLVSATYTDIPANEAFALLSNDPTVFILDVRTQGEYQNDGHIPGAFLIPHTQVKTRANELPTDHGAPILVYCRSGARSRLASSHLVDLGYTNVTNMKDSFLTWRSKDYPVQFGSDRGEFPVGEATALLLTLLLLLGIGRCVTRSQCLR